MAYVHAMAKAYGKNPIDIAFPYKNYTEMESQLFNMFIFSEGIKQENKGKK